MDHWSSSLGGSTMAKSFTARLDEIVKRAKSDAKDGKLRKSFSRKFYNDVAEAVMNDPDYEFELAKVRDGKMEVVKTKPSRVFREKLFGPVMSTFNVDADDVKKFIETYQFSAAQANTLYDLMAAVNWEYMNTGKILRMPSKPDFVGAIYVKDVPETERTNSKTKEVTVNKKHKALVKKSVTPPWLKVKKKSK